MVVKMNVTDIKDEKSIREFKESGFTDKEINKMSDEEFVRIAVLLVDGKTKNEIMEM